MPNGIEGDTVDFLTGRARGVAPEEKGTLVGGAAAPRAAGGMPSGQAAGTPAPAPAAPPSPGPPQALSLWPGGPTFDPAAIRSLPAFTHPLENPAWPRDRGLPVAWFNPRAQGIVPDPSILGPYEAAGAEANQRVRSGLPVTPEAFDLARRWSAVHDPGATPPGSPILVNAGVARSLGLRGAPESLVATLPPAAARDPSVARRDLLRQFPQFEHRRSHGFLDVLGDVFGGVGALAGIGGLLADFIPGLQFLSIPLSIAGAAAGAGGLGIAAERGDPLGIALGATGVLGGLAGATGVFRPEGIPTGAEGTFEQEGLAFPAGTTPAEGPLAIGGAGAFEPVGGPGPLAPGGTPFPAGTAPAEGAALAPGTAETALNALGGGATPPVVALGGGEIPGELSLGSLGAPGAGGGETSFGLGAPGEFALEPTLSELAGAQVPAGGAEAAGPLVPEGAPGPGLGGESPIGFTGPSDLAQATGGVPPPPMDPGRWSDWLGSVGNWIAQHPFAIPTAGLGVASTVMQAGQAAEAGRIAREGLRLRQEGLRTRQEAARPAVAFGTEALRRAQAGELSPAMQARVEQFRTQTMSQIMNQLSRAGIASSTMAEQWRAWVDQQALALTQQLVNEEARLGIAAVGTGAGAAPEGPPGVSPGTFQGSLQQAQFTLGQLARLSA